MEPNDRDSNLQPSTVSRTVTATGFRVSSLIDSGDQFEESDPVHPGVKVEPLFTVQDDWYLVGGTIVDAVSTTEGENKLLDDEIVYFTFPSPNASSCKLQSVVSFSSKRCEEIGHLPVDWEKWVIPLVYSNKVKVVGRCIDAPVTLSIKQEIMLFVSFYIHSSVFTSGDKSSWMFDLFRYLKIKPYQKVEFAPEKSNSGKRDLDTEDDDSEVVAALPPAKRRKGFQGQGVDEQAISVSSLNKIVGAEDTYNLKEMEPPNTLTSTLRPFQKQALYWMSEWEKGIHAENAAEILHPCWGEYRIQTTYLVSKHMI